MIYTNDIITDICKTQFTIYRDQSYFQYIEDMLNGIEPFNYFLVKDFTHLLKIKEYGNIIPQELKYKFHEDQRTESLLYEFY